MELSSLSPPSPPQYAFLTRISLWVGMVYRLPRNLREPLPMGPLASSPPGFVAMDHTPLFSPVPITHLSRTFPVAFFLCVYACTCVCMFTRGRMSSTCASVVYACVRRPKVAVSGNVFSSFPFYSFEHFSPLLFWGRAFFFFIYLFYTLAAAFPYILPSQFLLPISLFPQSLPFSSPTI